VRFDKLTYSHTEEFDNQKEIKFFPNMGNEDEDLSIEIWIETNSTIQDRKMKLFEDHIVVVIVNNLNNEYKTVTEKEKEFILKFAKENNLM
jgi:hypothetical protein